MAFFRLPKEGTDSEADSDDDDDEEDSDEDDEEETPNKVVSIQCFLLSSQGRLI